jgi:hypothetical protein
MTEPRQRTEKKSETLEVRLPHETKQAFLTACREDGTTASEVVRESIQDYLDERERPATQSGDTPEKRTLIAMIPQPIRKKRWLAAGAGAAGLALWAALPSAAGPDFRAMFDRLDKNHDGQITAEEFASPVAAPAGADDVRIEMSSIRRAPDGAPAGAPPPGAPADEEFIFQLPDGVVVGGGAGPGTRRIELRTHIENAPDGAAAPNADTMERHVAIQRRGPPGAPGEPAAANQPARIPPEAFANMRQDQFRRLDGNNDGKVSLEEYSAHQTRALTNGYNKLDANHDGGLTTDEYLRLGQPLVLAGSPADTHALEQEALQPLVPEAALRANFTRLDADHNGKVTLQEYLR